jgi:hypothetical protein
MLGQRVGGRKSGITRESRTKPVAASETGQASVVYRAGEQNENQAEGSNYGFISCGRALLEKDYRHFVPACDDNYSDGY